MKIKLTRNTIVNGEAHEAGEVLEASERDARYLVTIGKAVEASEKAKAAKAEPVAEPASELEAEKADAADALIAQAIPGGKRPRKAVKK